MKVASFTLSLIAFSILTATASQAQQPTSNSRKITDERKPISEWTCADLLGTEDTLRPKLVYWASGYSRAGEPEATIIDVKGLESVVPVVAQECRRTPQESFLQKLDSVWKSIETKL